MICCQKQETVKRLCSVIEAEMDVDRWFQNHVPPAGTEDEAPQSWWPTKAGMCFSLQCHTRPRTGTLTALDTHEQGLQGETVPEAHVGHCKRNDVCSQWVTHVKGPWGLQQRTMWGSPPSSSWGMRYCWEGATTSRGHTPLSTAALSCGTNNTQARTWAKSRKIIKSWESEQKMPK